MFPQTGALAASNARSCANNEWWIRIYVPVLRCTAIWSPHPTPTSTRRDGHNLAASTARIRISLRRVGHPSYRDAHLFDHSYVNPNRLAKRHVQQLNPWQTVEETEVSKLRPWQRQLGIGFASATTLSGMASDRSASLNYCRLLGKWRGRTMEREDMVRRGVAFIL